MYLSNFFKYFSHHVYTDYIVSNGMYFKRLKFFVMKRQFFFQILSLTVPHVLIDFNLYILYCHILFADWLWQEEGSLGFLNQEVKSQGENIFPVIEHFKQIIAY